MSILGHVEGVISPVLTPTWFSHIRLWFGYEIGFLILFGNACAGLTFPVNPENSRLFRISSFEIVFLLV